MSPPHIIAMSALVFEGALYFTPFSWFGVTILRLCFPRVYRVCWMFDDLVSIPLENRCRRVGGPRPTTAGAQCPAAIKEQQSPSCGKEEQHAARAGQAEDRGGGECRCRGDMVHPVAGVFLHKSDPTRDAERQDENAVNEREAVYVVLLLISFLYHAQKRTTYAIMEYERRLILESPTTACWRWTWNFHQGSSGLMVMLPRLQKNKGRWTSREMKSANHSHRYSPAIW
jgi:hypothetical protein